MAETTTETTPETTQTDIFQQQQATIELLQDVLRKQPSAQPQQIVYATPAEPQQKQAPNYLLYAGLAIAAIWFLKGK